MICASEAPETAFDDDAVVGAETARATVEAGDDDEEVEDTLRALRGEATATAGLAQAVRAARWDAGATAERGATTLERAAVFAAIIFGCAFGLFLSVAFCSRARAVTGCSEYGMREKEREKRSFSEKLFFCRGKRKRKL